ncbi:unnamed protein product, partial [Ixodes hexagonus]
VLGCCRSSHPHLTRNAIEMIPKEALKEPSDEVPSGGDGTRNPIFHSVKKLRDFWTRWQKKESKIISGSLRDRAAFGEETICSRSSSRISSSTLDSIRRGEQSQRPPRYGRLRELARKVSSRFSTIGSDADFYREDQAVASNCDTAKDPFLTSRARDLAFFGHGSAGMSSLSESTMSAYTDVSLEMSHRLKSRPSRSQDRHNTVFPSHLFRRSSLELSKSNYTRLRCSTDEDSDDIP